MRAARRGAGRRRRAAGRRLRARHGQPVPRGRLAPAALRALRARRRHALPRARGCSSAGIYLGGSAGWSLGGAGRRGRAGALRIVGLLAAAGGGGGGRRPGGGRAVRPRGAARRPTWCRFARLAAFGLTHAALGRGGLGGHHRRCGPRRAARRRWPPCWSSWSATPSPSRSRPGRRRPGPAPGVLRAVLPGLRPRGPALPALARPARRRRRRSTAVRLARRSARRMTVRPVAACVASAGRAPPRRWPRWCWPAAALRAGRGRRAAVAGRAAWCSPWPPAGGHPPAASRPPRPPRPPPANGCGPDRRRDRGGRLLDRRGDRGGLHRRRRRWPR